MVLDGARCGGAGGLVGPEEEKSGATGREYGRGVEGGDAEAGQDVFISLSKALMLLVRCIKQFGGCQAHSILLKMLK